MRLIFEQHRPDLKKHLQKSIATEASNRAERHEAEKLRKQPGVDRIKLLMEYFMELIELAAM